MHAEQSGAAEKLVMAFVENGRLMALVIAVLIISGLAAISALPRTEDPHLVRRTAMVITPFPGASAERVEALVTERLEAKLRELHELETVTSSSRAGLSFITLDIDDRYSKEESDLIISRARDYVAEVQALLPEGVGKAIVHDNRSHAFTMLLALKWQPGSDGSILTLGRYAKELESRLRGVYGSDRIQLYGAPVEEIWVSVDAQRLAASGLTALDVGRALSQADTKVAAGQLVNQQVRLSVEVAGELDSLERIRSVPLRVSSDGSVIRVGDVAEVVRQEVSPLRDLAVLNDQRGIVLGTRMVPDLRVDYWTSNVERRLEEFSEILPEGVELEILFSQDDYTQARLGELSSNIALGFALILLVLFVTLGWRSALIVSASLPLTVMFTFFCMWMVELPIHQMSITGLIVALGIMVDNAIVMVDTVHAEKRLGHGRLEAVARAVRHLWLPLLGSTLTTVLAFMPIVLVAGAMGEFVGGIGITVIFSLIGSYIISHTLIAGLGGRFVVPLGRHETAASWWHSGVQMPKFAAAFKKNLVWSLGRPWVTLSLVLVAPIMGILAVKQLPEQFFPPSDRDMFYVEVFLPNVASIDATRALAGEISDEIKRYAGIQRIDWFIGRSSPPFYYNLISKRDGSPNYAQAVVTTDHLDITNAMVSPLQSHLDERFPMAQVLVRKLEQGPPVNAPVELRVYGPNVERLKILGEELRRIMNSVPAITHTRSSLGSAMPKLWVTVDEDGANAAGLRLADLSRQLQNALDGISHGSLLESTEQIPVRVRFAGDYRLSPDELASLDFVSHMSSADDSFSGMPLSSIAQLQLQPSRGVITRRDGRRVNTIEGYVRAGVLPSVALQQIRQRLEEEGFSLPKGYQLEGGGESEKRDQNVSGLMATLDVILILLVVVVVLSFNSFRLAGIVFTVAILAAGLGLLSLYLFGFPFGFTSIIGLVGLMGLAINAAIVILAELKADGKAVTGDRVAIVEGVQRCARHITSTTITTVGGFLPLILSGGGFWPPFAIVIAGGTVLATMVSFFYVPVLFLLFARRRAFEVSGPGER